MANVVEKARVRYIIALIFMLFFVLNDLIFDFLFNFEGSDYIAFAFTLMAAIIVFYSNYKLKKSKVENEFGNMANFIKSNFDNWQVLFSILDIVCGIISLLSGVAFLACFFKTVKIGYVPVKIIVVANKEKSLIKAISKVSCLWVSGRLLSESRKEKSEDKKEDISMFKKIWKGIKNAGLWIFANKKSILGTMSAIISGVLTAVVANADLISILPKLVISGFDIMPYIAGLIIAGLTELGVTGKGFEAIKTFFERVNLEKQGKAEAKKLKEETAAAEKAKKEAEQAEKKQAEEDKKALELLAQKEAEEKAEKEKIAEEERLLARAKLLKAQQEAQAQVQNIQHEVSTQMLLKKQE